MGCLSCLGGLFLNILTWIAQVLKIACAVTIILIVALQLTNVTVTIDELTVEADCLLGNDDGEKLCNYAYAVCGLSIVASMVISMVLCCTCELCGLGFIVETAFSCFGMLWWLAASLVFAKTTSEANTNAFFDNENIDWRNAVTVISWVSFGLWTFVFTVFLFQLLGKVCSCMNCCSDDDKATSKV